MAPMWVVAVSMIAAQPGAERGPMIGAPAEGPNARYCMRIEAPTGTRVEPIRCWTRREWADQGVDVDRAWPTEGVAIRR
jgi:hypothetical protein